MMDVGNMLVWQTLGTKLYINFKRENWKFLVVKKWHFSAIKVLPTITIFGRSTGIGKNGFSGDLNLSDTQQ